MANAPPQTPPTYYIEEGGEEAIMGYGTRDQRPYQRAVYYVKGQPGVKFYSDPEVRAYITNELHGIPHGRSEELKESSAYWKEKNAREDAAKANYGGVVTPEALKPVGSPVGQTETRESLDAKARYLQNKDAFGNPTAQWATEETFKKAATETMTYRNVPEARGTLVSPQERVSAEIASAVVPAMRTEYRPGFDNQNFFGDMFSPQNRQASEINETSKSPFHYDPKYGLMIREDLARRADVFSVPEFQTLTRATPTTAYSDKPPIKYDSKFGLMKREDLIPQASLRTEDMFTYPLYAGAKEVKDRLYGLAGSGETILSTIKTTVPPTLIPPTLRYGLEASPTILRSGIADTVEFVGMVPAGTERLIREPSLIAPAAGAGMLMQVGGMAEGVQKDPVGIGVNLVATGLLFKGIGKVTDSIPTPKPVYRNVEVGEKTIYKGISVEWGSRAQPIIGRTETGLTIGTPKLKLPELKSYTPGTATDTRVVVENLPYSPEELANIKDLTTVMRANEGVSSSFKAKSLESIRTRAFDKYFEAEAAVIDFARQERAVIGGSVAQNLQLSSETFKTEIKLPATKEQMDYAKSVASKEGITYEEANKVFSPVFKRMGLSTENIKVYPDLTPEMFNLLYGKETDAMAFATPAEQSVFFRENQNLLRFLEAPPHEFGHIAVKGGGIVVGKNPTIAETMAMKTSRVFVKEFNDFYNTKVRASQVLPGEIVSDGKISMEHIKWNLQNSEYFIGRHASKLPIPFEIKEETRFFKEPRMSGDFDITLKNTEAEAIVKTKELYSTLNKIMGSEVRISPEKPTLIETLNPETGKWTHAVDIHYKDAQPYGMPEMRYGFNLGSKTTSIEGVKFQDLGDQGVRKASSSIIIHDAPVKVDVAGKEFNLGKIAPQPWRVKDIADTVRVHEQLLASKNFVSKMFSGKAKQALYDYKLRNRAVIEAFEKEPVSFEIDFGDIPEMATPSHALKSFSAQSSNLETINKQDSKNKKYNAPAGLKKDTYRYNINGAREFMPVRNTTLISRSPSINNTPGYKIPRSTPTSTYAPSYKPPADPPPYKPPAYSPPYRSPPNQPPYKPPAYKPPAYKPPTYSPPYKPPADPPPYKPPTYLPPYKPPTYLPPEKNLPLPDGDYSNEFKIKVPRFKKPKSWKVINPMISLKDL